MLFSPLILGIVGAPVLKLTEFIGNEVEASDSVHSFREWRENTPLIRAVKRQNEKKVAKLLEKGNDPNEPSEYGERTPLTVSCNSYDDTEKADRITKMLLEAGADANKEFKWNNDAMENAVKAKRDGAEIFCL